MRCDMNILLISAFEKSYFLAKTLSGQGHHITLISKDQNLCRSLYEAFDIPSVAGDAGDSSILEQADIGKMDIVIAQSENDAENLVVCELAKKEYHVKSAIAVVNNPANIAFFQQNGVDYCISEADVIDSLIKKGNIGNSIRKFLPTGDTITVTGVYYESCREHGGEPDVHGISLAVENTGAARSESISVEKILSAVGVVSAALILFIIYTTKNRNSSH